MKTPTLFMLLLAFSVHTLLAQGEAYESTSDVTKYLRSEVPAEFGERFAKDKDKENFKSLREFLQEKEELLDNLYYEKANYPEQRHAVLDYTGKIDRLKAIIKGKGANETVEVSSELMKGYQPGSFQFVPMEEMNFTVSAVEQQIGAYQLTLDELNRTASIRVMLDRNMAIVKQDITACRRQIDSTLAPEYKQQEFRRKISLYFTILIGVLLCIFFFIVYRRSDRSLSKELLSGNGLQFVTLFVLIIAIILFGILNILQGSELAAILSGISGYILGKGTKTVSNGKNGNEQAPPVTPPVVVPVVTNNPPVAPPTEPPAVS